MSSFPTPIITGSITFIAIALAFSCFALFLKQTKKLSRANSQCVRGHSLRTRGVRATRRVGTRFAHVQKKLFAHSALAGLYHMLTSLLPSPQAVLLEHHCCNCLRVDHVGLHLATPVAPSYCAYSKGPRPRIQRTPPMSGGASPRCVLLLLTLRGGSTRDTLSFGNLRHARVWLCGGAPLDALRTQ